MRITPAPHWSDLELYVICQFRPSTSFAWAGNIQILFLQKLVTCCPSRFYTKQIRRHQRHLKSGNSLYFKHSKHKYIYTFNSNIFLLHRFMEALSYIIHNLPPHHPQQACLVRISLTVSCLLVLSILKRRACLQALLCTHWQSICPCISFQYRSFTPGSKELLSYLRAEDYQKPLTDFRSFPEINKLVLLAGERQEVSHTFLITQMQNSWDSSRLKSQEMGLRLLTTLTCLPACISCMLSWTN